MAGMTGLLPGFTDVLPVGWAKCLTCSVLFRNAKAPGERGRIKRYCSDMCRFRAPYRKRTQTEKKCKTCQKLFLGTKIQAYCSQPCKESGIAEITKSVISGRVARLYGHLDLKCKRCGRGFTPKRERKGGKTPAFCGYKCSASDRLSRTAAEREAMRQATESRKQEARDKKARSRPWVVCQICSTSFQSSTPGRRFCSASCYNKRDRIDRTKKPRQAIECSECGKECEKTGRSPKLFCSRSCQKTMAKRNRKATKKKAFVEPVGIVFLIKRDKGCCRICGESVDLSAVAPDPRSATVDHIFPLSKGGKHSKANTQLAHFYCNAIKRDTVVA